jgi:hypothetical protein
MEQNMISNLQKVSICSSCSIHTAKSVNQKRAH